MDSSKAVHRPGGFRVSIRRITMSASNPYTFRAAVWVAANCFSDLRLTSEDQAHLSDEELMAAALEEAKNNDVDLNKGQIHIGDWTE